MFYESGIALLLVSNFRHTQKSLVWFAEYLPYPPDRYHFKVTYLSQAFLLIYEQSSFKQSGVSPYNTNGFFKSQVRNKQIVIPCVSNVPQCLVDPVSRIQTFFYPAGLGSLTFLFSRKNFRF